MTPKILKSPEAIERCKAYDRERSRRKREEARAANLAVLPELPVAAARIMKRKLMPRLPEMSKSELRAMFAQAAKNTAAM